MAGERLTKREWLARHHAAAPQRDARFTSVSDMPVEPAYGPEDVVDGAERVGWPGVYPFTRGPYPSMYRGRLWTM